MSAPSLVEWAKASQRVLSALLGDEAVPLADLGDDLVLIAEKSQAVHSRSDNLTADDVRHAIGTLVFLYPGGHPTIVPADS